MVHAEAKIFEIFKEALKNLPFYGGSAQVSAAGIGQIKCCAAFYESPNFAVSLNSHL
jgi:hypothetical protein